MELTPLSRRSFLVALGAMGAGSVMVSTIGCGSGGTESPPDATVDMTLAYRRSTKTKRSSKAANAHAANRVYVSAAAAAADPAHPGDHARVVTIDISPAQWQAWFGAGATMVDLRRI